MSKKVNRFLAMLLAFILIIALPAESRAGSSLNYYATTRVNVRAVSDNRVIGEKSLGDYVFGEKKDNYIYFTHNGVSAKAYEPFFIQARPIPMYFLGSSNIRDKNLNVVGKKYKGQMISAVKIGRYYRFYEDGVKLAHESVLTATALKAGVYVTGTVNIRRQSDESVIGSYRIGQYFEGVQKGSYILFSYKGIPAKVNTAYVKYDVPEKMYVKRTTPVYNNRFSKVGSKSTGATIKAVRIGNYYRFYENGTRFISSTDVTKDFVGVPKIASTSYRSPKLYSLSQFRYLGVIYWGGYKYTYYSQRVLPGGGLRIPGRHVNAGGYVADRDGYIVLANSAPKGKVFPTPFGYMGKVYDRGTYGNHLDVYTK